MSGANGTISAQLNAASGSAYAMAAEIRGVLQPGIFGPASTLPNPVGDAGAGAVQVVLGRRRLATLDVDHDVERFLLDHVLADHGPTNAPGAENVDAGCAGRGRIFQIGAIAGRPFPLMVFPVIRLLLTVAPGRKAKVPMPAPMPFQLGCGHPGGGYVRVADGGIQQ